MSNAAAAPVLGGFREVQAALKHPDLAQALYDAGQQVMGDALITLHGETHRRRRVMEFGVFSRRFFKHYEQQVFPAVLASALAGAISAGELDLVSFGYEVTMNLTAHFAGVDYVASDMEVPSSPASSATLLALVKKFSEGATLVHSRRDPALVEAEVAEALETFVEHFLLPSKARRLQLVMACERGELSADELPQDVMTTLLRNRASQPLSDDVFCREIAFYLQAGAHSTANATVRALHEIFDWRDRHPQSWRERRGDPLFLQQCVHESLRLYPASPVAWRRANRACSLGDTQLAAGERVVLDLAAANRDTQVFGEDAAEFVPGRLLPNGVWPFGLSFGYGIHACLGRDLDGGVLPVSGHQNSAGAGGATAPAGAVSADVPQQQIGIVTLLVRELLALGAARHPRRAATLDHSTVRPSWSSYPLRLSQESWEPSNL